MPDANELVDTLKRAAVEAVEAGKPVNVYFGEVVSASPLKINVEQKMILGEKQLILSRNVTDFSTMVTVDWTSESSLSTHNHTVKGDNGSGGNIDLNTGSKNLAHTHKITGKKKIIIHNGLAVGDEVILIRQQEGQRFIVVDRQMIPSTVGFLDQDFEIETQPSLTYKMDLDGDSVRGLVDEQDAMKQMIFRTLQTERYQYIIYPWYYGIETLDLYGEPVTWVCPELERRISEALAVDERITGVTDFEFDLTVKGVVHAYFTVKTIYGDIKAEKGVKI